MRVIANQFKLLHHSFFVGFPVFHDSKENFIHLEYLTYNYYLINEKYITITIEENM